MNDTPEKSASVHTLPHFNANVQALRDAGIEVSMHNAADDAKLDDIKLSEPQYGETILGALTLEEKAIFVDLYRANVELEGLTREYIGAAIGRIGDAIRTSDRSKPLNEAVGEQQMEFGSDENRQEFFRLQARINVLKATLWWSVGQRYSVHDFSCGVRSKFRVVKVASRV